MRPSLTFINGSLRALSPESSSQMQSISASATTWEEYQARISECSARWSNTDILLGAAHVGARSIGVEVRYAALAQLLRKRRGARPSWNNQAAGFEMDLVEFDPSLWDTEAFHSFQCTLESSSGLLVASPVYFGDRSSLLQSALGDLGLKNRFHGKYVAGVVAGAKRNGGQETALTALLHDFRIWGASVVGNGPDSSQYGGIGWGGDRGALARDAEGLRTSYETGRRLAEVVLESTAPSKSFSKPRIAVVCLQERASIAHWIRAEKDWIQRAEIDCIDLESFTIERCLACDICPIPELRETPETFSCVIPDDGMASIRKSLLTADAIVLAAAGPPSAQALAKFQAWMERTRILRRNDYELTDKLGTSLLLQDLAHPWELFELRTMNFFLRQNQLVLPPIRELRWQGKSVHSGKPEFTRLIECAEYAKARGKARRTVSYKAHGYRDKRLDSTEAIR